MDEGAIQHSGGAPRVNIVSWGPWHVELSTQTEKLFLTTTQIVSPIQQVQDMRFKMRFWAPFNSGDFTRTSSY